MTGGIFLGFKVSRFLGVKGKTVIENYHYRILKYLGSIIKKVK